MKVSDEDYQFVIHNRKHGNLMVTAPRKFKAAIDAVNWHAIMKYELHGKRHFVVSSHVLGEDGMRIVLHRFVMELAGCCPAVVDHRDRNPLNNSEDNLRDGSGSRNNMNMTRRRDNKSGVTGVLLRRDTGKWRACVWLRGRRVVVGNFPSIDEAREARNRAVAEHYGEYGVIQAALKAAGR